ncbi:MAG TPA: LutB/LldF family L-lactate oxidation iron-sulfur protein, partial [Pirellulales bacterium]
MTDYAVHEHREFLDATDAALADAGLQRSLVKLGDTLGHRNREAWAKLDRSDLVREKARAIKDETLAHMADHLVTLERAVAARGGKVHFAETAEEAREIIRGIVKAANGKRVVKSKSMTTEEIHLNPALEADGVEVVETDLGEFIIQVAGHRPSHLVAPAMHLNAGQIREILSRDAKRELPPEPEQLTQYARERLREAFATADVGITGANFVVAETGTVALVSNEGNARLTTTAPRVLISVAGFEKVIPKLADLPYFLKVLARAATGQKLSVYTSLVTGPRRPGEIDGPEEFHIVLLDNGRSKILGGPLRESLFCIRCGACLNACPVFRNIGGHAYGGVYSGPIGAILTPLYSGLAEHPHLPHVSSLCGACKAACPVKIAIPDMLVRLREQMHHAEGNASRLENAAYRVWAATLRSSWLYRTGTWLLSRTLGRFAGKSGWLSRLPGKLHGWTEHRDFPAPAPER